MPTLHAGAAQLDITPLLGISMPTFFNPHTAIDIHDPLHAKALALSAGDTILAMVCLDLLCLPQDDIDAARSMAKEQCGIPEDHILISTTHSHSVPGPANRFTLEQKPRAYHMWLRKRIADAVTMAHKRLQPARLGSGAGSMPQHVHNRRYLMKGGPAQMNPPRQSPDIIGPAGPTDPAVTTIAVMDEEDHPIAFVGNYALHYVGGTRGGEISADYYGAVGRHLNRIRAAEFPVLWNNGCSGDINNVDVMAPKQERRPYEQIDLVARDAATEASRVWDGMNFTDEADIAVLVDRFDIPLRRPSDAEMAEAKKKQANKEGIPFREWVLAEEMILASQMPSPEQTEVQAIRINDMAVVALSGEIFCQLGLDLKARSPFERTMIVSLANGYIGYIPVPEAFDQGSYETWLVRTSRCAPEVGPMLVDRADALLQRLVL
ncbi:MAG: hypothetical protein GXP25_04970 [Planctomycetes bacterium]|nr:hypothetical protein [Planctomycetota bacterium]